MSDDDAIAGAGGWLRTLAAGLYGGSATVRQTNYCVSAR